ncbi:unnamed protein product [Alopecurus aequalis]
MPSNTLLFLLLTLLLTAKSISPTTNHKILIDIKREWGNPPQLASWNTTVYCSWTGVSCVAGGGRVTGLSFKLLNLTGRVPPSVCGLRGLIHLDLSWNKLTGPFPGAALYPCTKLHSLDLSNNAFDGVLPDEISRLSPFLTELSLSSNRFSGVLPTTVGELRALKSLLFDTNKFRGQIPASFSSLREMTMLDMSGNELSGAIPIWIWQHPKLQKLYLFYNKLSGELPSIITAVNLVEMDLSSNKLNGTIPEGFGTLKKLTTLFLYFNQFSGTIPTSIGLLPNLQYIQLFDNMLSGELPPELGKHSPLANLEVSNNYLSGLLPDQLCANGKLYGIVVSNNSFSGEIPTSIGNCQTMENIILDNNSFSGEFPYKIWSLPLLKRVVINKNKFTGVLPSVIPLNIIKIEMRDNNFFGSFPTLADGLVVFMAERNQLTGVLPLNTSTFGNLTDLSLSGNNISGSIPTSIASLQKLNLLNLSDNQITGVIPPLSIGFLPSLSQLDLSGNELSGGIPADFANLNFGTLNLSCNNLTGEVPPSLQIELYERSFLGNSGLCARQGMKVNLPTCGHVSGTGGHNEKSSTSRGTVLAILCIIGGCIIGIIMSIVGVKWIFPWLQGWNENHVVANRILENNVVANQIMWFTPLTFIESDILNNIQENNIIGTGGYGTVYHMRLSSPSSDEEKNVAVKKIGNRENLGRLVDKQFEVEVKSLGDIRHKNIVSLLGYSRGHKFLIYEYMERGSLHSLLHQGERNTEPLDWPTRLAIAMDVARGLSHMHGDHGQTIVHRDIKSKNILLSSDFRAKIGDFGIAKELANSLEPTSSAKGTYGYMAPEYYESLRVSPKIDVFSFGVVMLELTTGKIAANDVPTSLTLVAWARQQFHEGLPKRDVADEHIPDLDNYMDAILAVFRLGVSCTMPEPENRPTMKDVMHILEYDISKVPKPILHKILVLQSTLDITKLAVAQDTSAEDTSHTRSKSIKW